MIPLPVILQAGNHDCGAAVATAVLRLHGVRISLADCTQQLHTSGLDGTDPRTLESFLRAHGLRVLAGEMDLVDLRQQTHRGRPVVCVVAGHYVAVAGVRYSRVHYLDPSCGLQVTSVAQFAAWWADHDRLGSRYDGWGLCVWREP